MIALVAQTAFGAGNPLYYVFQLSTALILFLAANTSYNAFPRLAALLAADGYFPRQFAFRGDRLAFSWGIILLSAVAAALIIAFGGVTTLLIPLYSVGVFVCFTLSQGGMVLHWRRHPEPGWRRRMVINAVGAVMTAVVLAIVVFEKFAGGAYLVVILIPTLVGMMLFINRQYAASSRHLALRPGYVVKPPVREERAVVPIPSINRATVRAINVARSITTEVMRRLHQRGPRRVRRDARRSGTAACPGVPLVIVESPYRALAGPLVAYLDVLDKAWPPGKPQPITFVVIPEYVARHWWERDALQPVGPAPALDPPRPARTPWWSTCRTGATTAPTSRTSPPGTTSGSRSGPAKVPEAADEPAEVVGGRPVLAAAGMPGHRSARVGDHWPVDALLTLTWDELDRLVARLADEVGRDHDLVLAISRGGLVPAGMLAYRLDLHEILVAGAVFYRPEGGTHPAPVIGHFPDASLLDGRRVLVVDEVWETGETMTEILARVRAAGGIARRPRSSTTSRRARGSPGRPDHHAADRRRLGRVPVQGGRLTPTRNPHLSNVSAASRSVGPRRSARAGPYALQSRTRSPHDGPTLHARPRPDPHAHRDRRPRASPAPASGTCSSGPPAPRRCRSATRRRRPRPRRRPWTRRRRRPRRRAGRVLGGAVAGLDVRLRVR